MSVAITFAKEKEEKAASRDELEKVKKKQSKLERRVGAIEEHVKIIRRKIR